MYIHLNPVRIKALGLGKNAGMRVDAVSKAIARINRCMEVNQKLRKFYNSGLSKLEESEA